jgi:hypothetical protein
MAQASCVYSFQGGDVPKPEPSLESLRQSARSWIAMASINQADSDRLLEEDDLIRAEQQLRFAEANLVRARTEIAEALTLRGGK